MRVIVNKPTNKLCELCNKEFSLYSFPSHLKHSHQLTSDEYSTKFGEFRKIKSPTIRNVKKVTCQLCNKKYSSVGLFTHLRDAHQSSTEAYIKKFGDFRVNSQKAEKLKKDKDLFKCVLCADDATYTSTAMSFHLTKKHNLTKEEYIMSHLLNGVRPVCKCGCNTQTKILSYTPPHCREYVSGHNSHGENNPNFNKYHSLEAKEKMRLMAKNRIENTVGTLPMHRPESIRARANMQTEKFIEKTELENNIKILEHERETGLVYYKSKCNSCGSEFEQFHQGYFNCPVCHPRIRSNIENIIVEHIKKVDKNLRIIQNSRSILPSKLELDLYFPDKNLAIELDGLFWHGELQGKSKQYHLKKTKECEALGIHLIHVFEDEWDKNPTMVLNKIAMAAGYFSGTKIYARKCIVKTLGAAECKTFLELNHLQGADISPIRFGLFYEEKLVSVMTFGKPNITRGNRKNEIGVYELNRFAVMENVLCVGGASKLLNHFIKTHNPKKIITYSDLRWSRRTTNLYTKIGFSAVSQSDPNYWYFKPRERKRYHRFNFTKRKLLELGHSKDKSEWQIMQEIGYDRIWDCGHLKYEMVF